MSTPALHLEAIARRLAQTAEQDVNATPLVAEPWLVDSWKEGKPFQHLLASAHQKTQPPTKSQIANGIDFYYDTVARHAAATRDRPALRYFDNQRGWLTLSFGDLHSQTNQLVERWQKRGVAPGKSICVLGDIGPKWLLAVLCTLRLGGTLTILPASNIEYSLRRISALKPSHIACEAVMAALLRSRLDKALAQNLLFEDPLPGIHHSGSHTYPPDDAALLLFSAVRPPKKPVKVSAEVLLSGLLRDALLLGIHPGDTVAYPFGSLLANQPTLLLCTLLAGATYVHAPPEEIQRNPRILGQTPIRVLGITDRLRDLLLKCPPGLMAETKLWFRNPEEPQQLAAWDRFLQLAPFTSIPHLNMVFDAAAGGSVLFSERRVKRVHGGVLPSPGVPFELKLTTPSGAKSLSGAGVFAPATQTPGYMLLAKTPDAFLYATTITPRRSGRVVATDDVLALSKTTSRIEEAAIVSVPQTEQPGRWLFVLLLFCGGMDAAAFRQEQVGALKEEIHKRLESGLGPDHLPDEILILPISPRRKKGAQGEVDLDWVQSQFASGILQRKAELSVYRTLSALRAAAQRTQLGRLASKSDPGLPVIHDEEEESDA